MLSVSCSVLLDSLRPHGLQPTSLLCPWDFPGTNTGVGCHFLLQRIFPTQESNPGLLHCRQILYQLSYRLYREGKKISPVCFLLPLKRDKSVWHLQRISSIWRPLAFLPVTLSGSDILRDWACTHVHTCTHLWYISVVFFQVYKHETMSCTWPLAF